jgi:hypothetical protein
MFPAQTVEVRIIRTSDQESQDPLFGVFRPTRTNPIHTLQFSPFDYPARASAALDTGGKILWRVHFVCSLFVQ